MPGAAGLLTTLAAADGTDHGFVAASVCTR